MGRDWSTGGHCIEVIVNLEEEEEEEEEGREDIYIAGIRIQELINSIRMQ